MINYKDLETKTIKKLLELYPFLEEFLTDNLIEIKDDLDKTLVNLLKSYDLDILEEKALDVDNILEGVIVFVEQMSAFLGLDDNSLNSITILPGFNKLGEAEGFDELTIKKGEIISIVGPTGSGKSRLLADIEWGAQGDTPTKRSVLINGKPMDLESRFSSSNKLVAQLSQNMNFIMDLTVHEFLELHAKSRMIEDEEIIIAKIFAKANELAGEGFELDTPITSLSGGQSRSLMIADTAILSSSPIVLIDEIENAGIDRKKALELLVGEDKIVLMATHDPILALMAQKRIVINKGGIIRILEISDEEKEVLHELEALDSIIQGTRTKLRYGKTLELQHIK